MGFITSTMWINTGIMLVEAMIIIGVAFGISRIQHRGGKKWTQ